MKYGAVILAAGRGARFHGTKQDVIFHGKPLWRWPFDLLCELVDKENIVIVGKDVAGGNTRTESVKIGLHAIAKKHRTGCNRRSSAPIGDSGATSAFAYGNKAVGFFCDAFGKYRSRKRWTLF